MILRLIESWIALFTDMKLPALPPVATSRELDPPSDGRIFAWVRVKDYAGMNPIYPVVLHQKGVGPPLEYVDGPHIMQPGEYGLTISELAAIYKVPKV